MDPAVKAQRQLETIEGQIAELEAKARADKDAHLQLKHLQHQITFLREQIRTHVNAWTKTELARHGQRPFTLDYVERIFTNWSEVHGDRGFGDEVKQVGRSVLNRRGIRAGHHGAEDR